MFVVFCNFGTESSVCNPASLVRDTLQSLVSCSCVALIFSVTLVSFLSFVFAVISVSLPSGLDDNVLVVGVIPFGIRTLFTSPKTHECTKTNSTSQSFISSRSISHMILWTAVHQ